MRCTLTVAFLFVLASPAFGDLTTAGFQGVNARATGLTGAGIVIGMAEPGRPGDPDKDMASNFHSQVDPEQVYSGTSIDGADSQFTNGINGDHANEVAGVMIAQLLPTPAIVARS